MVVTSACGMEAKGRWRKEWRGEGSEGRRIEGEKEGRGKEGGRKKKKNRERKRAKEKVQDGREEGWGKGGRKNE